MEIPNDLYLDTNILHPWFRKIMENRRKNQQFEMPDVIKFVSSKSELSLSVSDLTKVEIARYLFSEWKSQEIEVDELWERFLRTFDISSIIVKEMDFEDLIKVCKAVPTKKKTLVNLMHLQIAKNDNLWFLTGEEKLKENYKEYYDKVLTYEDLRKLFP